MRMHRYPPFALALLAFAGCETHVFTECPPGARCVVVCDQAGHECRVEVDGADAGLEPEQPGPAQPEPPAEPEPSAQPEPSPPIGPDHPQPVAEPEPTPGEPEPTPGEPEPTPGEPEPHPDPNGDACVSLCTALDASSAACALSVLRAAHPDCERPPVCEDLLDGAGCRACMLALGTDCTAVQALCVGP